MSSERHAQWTHRLHRLQSLREHFVAARRYDRAHKAHLTIHHVYDRWADELFRQQAQGR
jgi:hypothetical protein